MPKTRFIQNFGYKAKGSKQQNPTQVLHCCKTKITKINGYCDPETIESSPASFPMDHWRSAVTSQGATPESAGAGRRQHHHRGRMRTSGVQEQMGRVDQNISKANKCWGPVLKGSQDFLVSTGSYGLSTFERLELGVH